MYRRGFFVSLCFLAFTCGEAPGVPDELSAACLRQAQCAGEELSAQDERECREGWLAQYDEASTYGCATPHADWVSCLATMECPPAELDVSVDEADPASFEPCESQRLAFERCQGRAGRDDCFVLGFGGGGGCLIRCALFAARCQAPGKGGSGDCSCEEGANVGATFSVACPGAEDAVTPARSACQ